MATPLHKISEPFRPMPGPSVKRWDLTIDGVIVKSVPEWLPARRIFVARWMPVPLTRVSLYLLSVGDADSSLLMGWFPGLILHYL